MEGVKKTGILLAGAAAALLASGFVLAADTKHEHRAAILFRHL